MHKSLKREFFTFHIRNKSKGREENKHNKGILNIRGRTNVSKSRFSIKLKEARLLDYREENLRAFVLQSGLINSNSFVSADRDKNSYLFFLNL